MTTNATFTRETMMVEGGQLLATVKRLIHEGNVRRIIIRQGKRSIAEFPLTVGVVGVLFAPVLAAIGALGALITDCTIEVEREEKTIIGALAIEVTHADPVLDGNAQN